MMSPLFQNNGLVLLQNCSLEGTPQRAIIDYSIMNQRNVTLFLDFHLDHGIPLFGNDLLGSSQLHRQSGEPVAIKSAEGILLNTSAGTNSALDMAAKPVGDTHCALRRESTGLRPRRGALATNAQQNR
jgi:hypothetical protein